VAQYFPPADSLRTVRVFSPGVVADVEVVGFRTIPSDVYGRVAIEAEMWENEDWEALVDPMARGIEMVMADDRVAAMSYEEDVLPNGLLVDLMVITVQAQGSRPGQFGPFYGETRARTEWFGNPAQDAIINPRIAAEYARVLNYANA